VHIVPSVPIFPGGKPRLSPGRTGHVDAFGWPAMTLISLLAHMTRPFGKLTSSGFATFRPSPSFGQGGVLTLVLPAERPGA